MIKRLFSAVVISALLLSLVVGLQVVGANSRTITVPDDYQSIQEAIGAAVEEDTIVVKSGVYTGNLVIDKSLTLIGNNRETTRIVGDQTGTTLLIKHSNVSVTGFTIQSPESSLLIWNRKRGIHLLDVSNCNISGNSILRNAYHEGIWLYGASENTITGNKVEGGDSGIKLEFSSSNIITNNSVLGNQEGISLHEANLNSFHTNFVVNNTYGFVVSDSNDNSFYANNITSYDHGVLIGKPGGYVTHVTNNTFHHNNFVNNAVNFGTYQVVVGVNYFDDGKEGNYYSDYQGEDNNGDGIGDTPYIIDANNKDKYPLMLPINFTESSNPTPTPSSNPTINPTTSITSTPTITPSISPSNSPTQQPTLEPSPTADGRQTEDFAPTIIIIGLVAIAGAISLLVYFRQKKG